MQFIETEIKDGVGIIRLNRPEVFNSFNMPMAKEVQKTLDEYEVNEEVRAIYLTGNGKAFCAGQDLQEATAPDGPAMRTIVQETYNPIIERLRKIEKPIIGAVNGVAAGAGANIALACDLCVATESASFIQAFSLIGLVPDSGGTFFLPRLVGMQKAAGLMMTGEKIKAVEADNMGMIYTSYTDETFAEESFKLATRLAKMPTKGLGLTKRLLNSSMTADLHSQLQNEENLQEIAGETNDYKEGVAAFLEKRKPVFKGN